MQRTADEHAIQQQGAIYPILIDSHDLDVEYRECDGMVHAWTLFSSYRPEGQEALEDIGASVNTETTVTRVGC